MLEFDVTNFIDGKMVVGESDRVVDSINPANGELLAKVRYASAEQAESAVQAAVAGQKLWASYSGVQRGRILSEVARLIRQNRMRIAKLEAMDAGKPISETPEADVDSAADCFEYFAAIAQTLQSEHIQVDGGFAYTTRAPLGVVFAIGAWNYPFQIASWKSAPALACGNSIIFKPAGPTPVTALELAKLMQQAGVPDGVFNVIHIGREIAATLCAHKDVAKVSLTGSVGTGQTVMAQCASTLKHVTMELGGKSPLIIFDDADMDTAIESALFANFYTQGEICTNGTRVFVQRPVYESFLQRMAARTEQLKLGDTLDPATDMGALIDPGHMETVLDYIRIGKAEGARLVTGGEPATEGALARGNFVKPTIFADCTDDMTIVREEIFGPVMSVLPFDTEDEVIRRANDSELGLAAGVITENLSRAHRVVAQLEAGTCWVNTYNRTPVNMPFGGMKMSGIGRENGWAAVDHFTERKTVFVAISKQN
jgi:betaine-aldehyde dehydrogenase